MFVEHKALLCISLLLTTIILANWLQSYLNLKYSTYLISTQTKFILAKVQVKLSCMNSVPRLLRWIPLGHTLTLFTVPLSTWCCGQADTLKMEPLYGTVFVFTSNHVSTLGSSTNTPQFRTVKRSSTRLFEWFPLSFCSSFLGTCLAMFSHIT